MSVQNILMGIPRYRELYAQIQKWDSGDDCTRKFVSAVGHAFLQKAFYDKDVDFSDVKKEFVDSLTASQGTVITAELRKAAAEKTAFNVLDTIGEFTALTHRVMVKLDDKVFAMCQDVVKAATKDAYYHSFEDAMIRFTISLQDKPEFLRKAVFEDLRKRTIVIPLGEGELTLTPEFIITKNMLSDFAFKKLIERCANPEGVSQPDPAVQLELDQLMKDYCHEQSYIWHILKAFILHVKPKLDLLRKHLDEMFTTVLGEKVEQLETLSKGAFGKEAPLYTSDLIALGRKFWLEESQLDKRTPGPNGDAVVSRGPEGIQKNEHEVDRLFDSAFGVRKASKFRGTD